MLALSLRYLNGWSLATHPTNREKAEWPPHPDRVFMALAAAHFETDGDDGERAALEWLESQPPPGLTASAAHARSVLTSYVPVNDVSGSELAALPERRTRQARTFPVAVPDDPVVRLVWDAEPSASQRAALAGLCRKVTCVGHSASLVQAWVEDTSANADPPALVPVAGTARYRLRVPGPGRLDYLRDQYAAGLRPSPAFWSGYDLPAPALRDDGVPRSAFDENLVVLRRVDGPAIGLETTLQLTAALRDATMKRCETQPPPEWISGHQPDGRPSQRAHLAFLPLAHVGREHAEGRLLGVALAVPREAPREARRQLRSLLYDDEGEPRTIELRFGPGIAWQVVLEEREGRPLALAAETWTAGAPAAPARRWATVTPIVFDRHPKSKDPDQAAAETEAMIRLACVRAGLPEPRDVVLASTSMFEGAPPARRYPMIQRKSGGNLHHAHAVLAFAEPIRGPLLVGAGRYRGYGFCRPLRPPGGFAS